MLLKPGEEAQDVYYAIGIHYREMAFGLFLASLQGTIIYFTRKLSRDQHLSSARSEA